ncbi:MAG: DUF3288 family protein [Cyanobacteria bacterium]|uniref:DUF3288 family protein n=1 Tax=Geminocystis sp. TaxID=2664100 RepID=UPI001DC258AF|nr:DUF3288 family protein [Cyanobacteria bacterium CG_2015-16_32_12]NCO77324.1 DUF3288 family protein [Cyanobacteria bacterium CG_2015-22_32_23]NCQ05487.1 DUF3288 family protein [Cyanobacteria bacterium CG_2015-09_32_10]NCQ42206.1 DUF3288 family protein [Cyanobacteria bacterium CG_2015-04_32_10]NCS84171.1 DUF3288 family protein [Cyanobacteria bacterium CG_2015-02_32_10]
MSIDQKHPLGHIDREIIKKIFVEGKTDYNIAEVARLKIRYQNFPGARDVQYDLESILKQWELTEEELFAQTRVLHSKGKVYRQHKDENSEDWS